MSKRKHFYNDLEDDTAKSSALLKRAISDAGTLEDVRAASIAVQANWSAFRFVTACKSKSQSEKEMFHAMWKSEEDQALAGLVYRTTVLMGGDRIVDDDGTVLAMLPVDPDAPKTAALPKTTPSRRARRAAAAGKRSS